MAQGLNGKTAVILGGGGGIGSSVAAHFRERGAEVVLVDRCGGQGEGAFVECDLSVAESIGAAFDRHAALLGNSTILVNAAGVYEQRLLPDTDRSSLLAQMVNDVVGPLDFVLRWVEATSTHAGMGTARRVVIVSSAAAFVGSRDLGYAASKGAMVSAGRSLGRHLAEKGIGVLTIAPGVVATPMSARMPAERRGQHVSQTVTKRACEPAEIANLAVMYCSGHCDYLSGTCVNLSNGLYP